MTNNNLTSKLIILGSGPAALTAAIYGARANLKPIVVQGPSPGGQLMTTSYVENWPGEISIMGPELISRLEKHAKYFGAEFLSRNITCVDFNNKFSLITEKNEVLWADSVIIATGSTFKKLNCKGEDKYWGKGVNTCAVCDGVFYKDKPVVIVGGGDSAAENAAFMTQFTDNITMIHILPKLTASYSMQNKILNNKKINIIYNSIVTEIAGDDKHIKKVIIKNLQTNKEFDIDASAVFVSIGLTPNTDIFKGQLELNDYGYIILKNHTQTSKEGIFAAGDVSDFRYKQAITSAGTGCAAAIDAERYLFEKF